MKGQKERSAKKLNPEKYKMVWCPNCRGSGKTPDAEGRTKVCHHCGGFGWVKKEN